MTQEYRVETSDNRLFIWTACDLDQLLRDLTRRGHFATKIQLLSEYEPEVEKQELAEVVYFEVNQAIEERVAV